MSTHHSNEPEFDKLKSHEYDGIQEYDNQLPRWWIGTFLLTLIFGVLYWFHFHVTGNGKDQAAELQSDIANHQTLHRLEEGNEPPFDDAAVAALATQPEAIESAKVLFTSNCSACHGAEGGGAIGPNLTDNAWIHGGSPREIYATIENGVAAKGMPAWHGILSSSQVRGLVAYIRSLQGSNPSGGKAPEGTVLP